MADHKNSRTGASAPNISIVSSSTKGILLDLDNTLYEYEPCHTHAVKKCHAFFNRTVRKISFDKFNALYMDARRAVKKHNRHTVGSRSRHLYFQFMLENELGASDVKNALRLGDIYWKAFLKKMARRPWVLKFLKDAKKRGIKIAVVTNLESSIQYKKLLRLGVADLVDFVVTSEEAGIEKPDPKIYRIALDKIGMMPDDVVMIGDNPKEDAVGAKNAGISFVLCG